MTMKHLKDRVLRSLAVLLAGFQLTANAQSLVMQDLGNGFQGAASLDLAYTRTDNFFYQPSNGSPAEGYFLRPNLLLDRDAGNVNFKFRVAGEYAKYELPDLGINYQDDYFDGLASAGIDWTAGTRSRFNLTGEYRRGHDALGLNNSIASTVTIEADEYDQGLLSGHYRFGAREAAINLDVRASTRKREYVTNRNNTRFLDFTTDSVGGTIFFNSSPKTAFLLDVGLSDTRFDTRSPGTPNNDGSTLLYRAGVQWKATAKTTGDIRLGYASSDYESGSKRDRANWVGSLVWSPATRTSFSFATAQTVQESYLTSGVVASGIDNQNHAVEWSQRWGSRLTTILGAQFVNSDFIGFNGFDPADGVTENSREDDLTSLVLGVEYTVTRFLVLLGSVGQAERDSSFSSSVYETHTSYVGIRLIP